MAPVSRWVDGSRAVARIVAVCQAIKDDLVRQGLPAAKIDVVYSGTDTDWFDPARASGSAVRQELGLETATPLVTQIGVREPKGNDDLLRAFARVRAARPDARLLLVGARPEKRAPLEALARAGGLGDAVTIWGYRDDVPDVLAAAQVSVDASYEGLGITGTLRESLAMETPVVATRAMGNPELVGHEAHGLLVPPRDPEAIAAADPPAPRGSGLGAEPRAGRPRAGRGGLLHPGQGRAARAPLRGRGSAPARDRADRPVHDAPVPQAVSGRPSRIRGRSRAASSLTGNRAAGPAPLLQYAHGIAVSVFKRLLPYVRPYWSWLVAGGLLAIVVSAADGLIAWLVKPAMDDIFIRRDLTMLEAPPARHPRGLRRQGSRAVRPVVHDGLRRRAGHHGAPARPLRAHPGHAARRSSRAGTRPISCPASWSMPAAWPACRPRSSSWHSGRSAPWSRSSPSC